jgi:Leucine-rich repeat (LRR) protein
MQSAEAYSEKTTIFTMHDLVHDLAISLLGNKLLDKSKQENTMRKNKDYQYAVLRDCRMPLWLTREAQLKALHFLECSGTALRGAAFAPATSLRVLDLSDCCSHKLPDSIGQLKELRYLNAPWTRDLQFPECITKLSHLIFLNLHGSDIEKIPESIGEMKDLRHLDLSCCRIKRLPDSFMSLQKLVHLDFSNCHLMLGESESLWSLSRLEHLSLSKCRIEGDLAKALCGLRELQYLELSHLFCWGNLGRGLQQVTKLMYLDIRGFLDRNIVGGAETETFIEAISSLSNLVYLNLGWNQNLYYIPESIGNLSKLRTLDLSHCINLERLPAAISGINNMKFVHVAGCDRLDKSTLPLYKNVAKLLPYFAVHAGDSESSSNLRWLEYENPTKLELSGLENVKSIGEAQRIKLVEKQRIQELGLVWTRDAKRFVDDEGVLKQLVPPYTVGQMRLQGYNSAGFPSWMMDIATYVPHLVDVTLEDMPNCSSLPPLGQLPNLKKLWIGRMESIRKIGQDLYGDCGAFPLLRSFTLQEMKCLEEWNTSYSYHNAGGKDASKKVLAFPNLRDLFIADCPMLRFKSLSPLALGKEMTITRSGQVVLSSWECRGQFDASSSARTTWLSIEHCEAPLHQWSLLRHLPHLTKLSINNCSDLTCSSTDLLRCLRSLEALYVRDCKSIAALPERLGDLTSLNKLDISNCEGVKALPESIQLLTRLRRLKINGCPQLVQFRCPPSLKTLYVRNCKSIVQLPQRLADLSSLKNLEIIECEGVKALPESIQQLTCLQRLGIYGCPQLLQWCQSKENKMKLAHIKERVHALRIYPFIMFLFFICID